MHVPRSAQGPGNISCCDSPRAGGRTSHHSGHNCWAGRVQRGLSPFKVEGQLGVWVGTEGGAWVQV